MSAGGGGTFGYLALLQLLASAGGDDRLNGFQRRAFMALGRFPTASDGTCCVSLSNLAGRLGCKRQVVQRAVKALAAYGYITITPRYRRSGAQGANVYAFNLDLAGADACPVVWPSQRVHLPEGAGGCTSQRVQGVHLPEGAHKKPVEETSSEETNASPSGGSRGQRRSRGKGASCLQGGPGRRQPSLLLPIDGSAAQAPTGAATQQRVAQHNRKTERVASGRLWGAWCDLDPDLSLYGRLGPGADKVCEKAQEIEGKRPGAGVKYLAGAIEKASGDGVTARAILERCYSRRAAAP